MDDKGNIEAVGIKLDEDQMERMRIIDKNYRYTKGQVFCWYENQPWEELWDEDDQLEAPQVVVQGGKEFVIED